MSSAGARSGGSRFTPWPGRSCPGCSPRRRSCWQRSVRKSPSVPAMAGPARADRFGARAATADPSPDPCCTGSAASNRALERRAERDAQWLRAARTARMLSWLSLAWMSGEGAVGLFAGIAAGSIALVGWGAVQRSRTGRRELRSDRGHCLPWRQGLWRADWAGFRAAYAGLDASNCEIRVGCWAGLAD